MKNTRTAAWQIPVADAYGGVLVTRHGEVLLIEPANHFAGYVWTLPKGASRTNETPEQTALREVEKDTGYPVEVVDVLPGLFLRGQRSSAYFVMRYLSAPGACGAETRRVRWAEFDRAHQLLSLTKNEQGRERDHTVLSAAANWFKANTTVVLPERYGPWPEPAVDTDWTRHPMPRRRVDLPLNFTLNAQESSRIRLGFIPKQMEDKWFAWFDPERLILNQHRSWTGYHIDRIHFVVDGEGLRAVRATVNRDVDQYSNTDDAEDVQRIESLVRSLAEHDLSVPATDGFAAALQSATGPGYLGSPQVILELLTPYIDSLLRAWDKPADYAARQVMVAKIASIFCEDHAEFTRMPNWHIREAMGEHLIRAFELNREYAKGESLAFVVDESLAAVALAFSLLAKRLRERLELGQEIQPQSDVDELTKFSVAAFLGTSDVLYPGQVIGDIAQ